MWPPKLLSSFPVPVRGYEVPIFFILLGLILNSFIFISVFRNLCTTCSSFQTLPSLLVGCLRDNWIWELNLQFVIENGIIRWLQIRTFWHITTGLFRVLWGEMEQMMSYPDFPAFLATAQPGWCQVLLNGRHLSTTSAAVPRKAGFRLPWSPWWQSWPYTDWFFRNPTVVLWCGPSSAALCFCEWERNLNPG